MSAAIRSEDGGDRDAVRAVLGAVFGRASEAALVERLRLRPDVFSLVATVDERVVGHVIFTPVEVIGARPRRPAVAVALLGVLAEFRSHGIGSQLVTRGLELCRERGAGVVFVIGPAAFYRRSGFVPAEPLGVRSRWRAAEGTFQLVELVPGELEHVRGVVRYLSEFSA